MKKQKLPVKEKLDHSAMAILACKMVKCRITGARFLERIFSILKISQIHVGTHKFLYNICQNAEAYKK